MKFNYYTNIKQTAPAKSLSIEEVVYIIQCNEYKEKIQTLRSYSKSDPTYSSLKKELPIFTFNATLKGSKAAKDVEALTDHMYFDLDYTDLPYDKSLEEIVGYLKTLPYVSAIWKSCGGNGLGFLTKIAHNNINPEEFSIYWTYIKDELNLPLDENCKNVNRQTFLSYDKDVYFNANATAFPFEDTLKLNKLLKEKHRNTFITNTPTLLETNCGVFKDLPNSYATQFEMPDCKSHLDYIFFPEGINVCNIWFGKAQSIPTGKRNRVLVSTTAKYLYNFPTVDFKTLYYRIRANNNIYCKEPLPENELKALVTSLYNSHREGKLSYPTKKKFVQLNYYKLKTVQEIRKASGRATGDLKKYRNETITKIIQAYIKLKEDGVKIKNKMLAEMVGVSLRTVEFYSKKAKQIVEHLYETGELIKHFESEHLYHGPLKKFDIHMGKEDRTIDDIEEIIEIEKELNNLELEEGNGNY